MSIKNGRNCWQPIKVKCIAQFLKAMKSELVLFLQVCMLKKNYVQSTEQCTSASYSTHNAYKTPSTICIWIYDTLFFHLTQHQGYILELSYKSWVTDLKLDFWVSFRSRNIFFCLNLNGLWYLLRNIWKLCGVKMKIK